MNTKDRIKELYSLNKVYSGFGIALRVITNDDLRLVQKWRNSESVVKFMAVDTSQNILQLSFWYNNLKKNNNVLAFIIVKDSVPVGFVEYKEFGFYESRSCVQGIFLDPLYHGQGIGTLVNFLQEQVLYDLDITTVVVSVRVINSRNVHLWSKLGAKVVKQDSDFYTFVSNREERLNSLDKIAVDKGVLNEWLSFKRNLFKSCP